MKTMAIRLDDEIAELLEMVAMLEDTSQIDQIREAIVEHLRCKVRNPVFAQKAQAALENIDRDASARKNAISTLLKGNIPTEE
jgi:predicted transcriptional regulator